MRVAVALVAVAIAAAAAYATLPTPFQAVRLPDRLPDEDAEDDDFEVCLKRRRLPSVLSGPQEIVELLYGLYKQATAGPCTHASPSRLDFVAHAKAHWHHWGTMPRSQARKAYVALARHLAPDLEQTPGVVGPRPAASGFGAVQSSLAHEGGEGTLPEEGTLLAAVRAGDVAAASTLLAGGTPADEPRDADGRTPLLWAADAGCAAMVAALLAGGADPRASDAEGATPLLNAAICGHEEAARLLLAAGADPRAQDSDGSCAAELRPAAWAAWWP